MSNNNGHGTQEVTIERRGDRIVIPEGMEMDDVCRHLRGKDVEEETVVSVSENIAAFPLDGAVALEEVLRSRYGWTNLKETITKGLFGGVEPPEMIGVNIGPNQTKQVPWGACAVPNIEGVIKTDFARNERGVPTFVLKAEVKRKHEKIIGQIAEEVRQQVAEKSIYRGQTVSMNFRDSDGDRIGRFSHDFAPSFVEINAKELESLVYSTDIELVINTSLMTPIRKSELCRKNGIPLKRGILMAGSYGTGKSLLCYKVALECRKNGWTFLYVKDVRDLDVALDFAKLYQPCVVFSEDVDRAMAGPRTDVMNQILNTMDGIDSKEMEVLLLLTTNFRQHINPACIRPGRIDTVIELGAPDEEAVIRLVRNYGKDQENNALIMATDEEIVTSLKKIKGANAAFVREAVELAKLSAINHCEDDGPLQIKSDDLLAAAASMEAHVKLLQPELLENEWESVEPAKLLMDLATDVFAGALLQKITNPKILEKILMKKSSSRPGFPFGGGGFSNN